MTGAVLLLQGLDDPVVPPDQARSHGRGAAARGVRCELLAFAGESHGFRRAETLEACLEAELAFYRRGPVAPSRGEDLRRGGGTVGSVVQGHGRGSPYCRAGPRESHGASTSEHERVAGSPPGAPEEGDAVLYAASGPLRRTNRRSSPSISLYRQWGAAGRRALPGGAPSSRLWLGRRRARAAAGEGALAIGRCRGRRSGPRRWGGARIWLLRVRAARGHPAAALPGGGAGAARATRPATSSPRWW